MFHRYPKTFLCFWDLKHLKKLLFHFLAESDYNVTDTESTCPIWAKAGWCQSNADLLDKCPHSCQKYGVQGASSLDERYITVNFQKTSPVKNLSVSEIAAPPPPSAAIQSHSDLDLVSKAFFSKFTTCIRVIWLINGLVAKNVRLEMALRLSDSETLIFRIRLN